MKENIITTQNNAKVLMVEDDEFFADIVLTKLKEHGFDVAIVTNGLDAHAAATKHKPAIILLDMMLPGLSGVEVLSQLKQDPELLTIPVIAFSNFNQDADVVTGKVTGAEKYMIKSETEFSKLHEVVIDILSRQP